ncbi:hypothetical protein LX16_4494 [Stackebrandtia albiflava]|uniref:HicB-like protein involved in pilus formation n=1 Tax=Stackebrandtia albiflava TaxID=406432 RepID=A0A562URN3_9ACTN|nr:YlcI/YnfO family protein [Stackebrandtia albiflava]TWJ08269.1 hypothetical protein LX16_4494 [Stackebrandtia albiflava]
MDMTSYVDRLGREIAALAETGGEEARAQFARLAGSLEPAIRLTLLEALSAAADEISRELAPGSVELRLRGRDPDFVVTRPPEPPPAAPEAPEPVGEDDPPGGHDGPTIRINLRLPERLKTAIEEDAAQEGRSLNAWLVRAASAALRRRDRDRQPPGRRPRGSDRYRGWVQ